MPIRFIPFCALSAALLLSAPVMAQDVPPPDDYRAGYSAAAAATMPQYHPGQREEWLAACEQRARRERTWGWTGPLLGAGLGGLAGNRIAGRHDRAIGTVAGAVAGGLVGAAVERSRSGSRARSWCEAYLDNALADYSRWYASQPPPPPVAPPPVIQQRRCTETTTVTTEEIAAPARRSIPRRPSAPARDKRVRLY